MFICSMSELDVKTELVRNEVTATIYKYKKAFFSENVQKPLQFWQYL